MRLQDIMTTFIETVEPGTSADTAWETMRRQKIHHLVVVEDGAMAGIISDRDLGGARGGSLRSGKTVRDLMSEEVVSAPPDATFKHAANLLRGRSIGCIPVMEEGELLGIVTISDLLELLGRGAEKPVLRNKRWTLKHRGQGKSRRQFTSR